MDKLKRLGNKAKERFSRSRSGSPAPRSSETARTSSTTGKLTNTPQALHAIDSSRGTAFQVSDPHKHSSTIQSADSKGLEVPISRDLRENPLDAVVLTPAQGVLPNLPATATSADAVNDKDIPWGPLDQLSSSQLWQKALKKVREDEKDWKKYTELVKENAPLAGHDFDSPEGLVAIAEDVSKQVEASKKSLKLFGRTIVVRDVVDKTLDVLSITKDVGAAITSLNPYASLAWGGVSFFVQVVVTHRDVTELCWDELPRMAQLISQYQTFECLYDISQLKKTGPQLGDALVELFSAILKYQLVVVKYASSWSERWKNAFQDKAESKPQQVLDDVKQYEEKIAKLQALADREKVDIQFQFLESSSKATSKRLSELSFKLQEANIKAQNLYTRTATHVESISTLLEQKRKDNILVWISDINYRDVHNSSQKTGMQGTGQWLIKVLEDLKWPLSKQPAVLWLHGKMGSGKSCLAHAVIDHVNNSTADAISKRLAYFYCDGTSGQGQSAIAETNNILRCLLQQLSCVGKDGKLMDRIVDVYNEKHVGGHLEYSECEKLIRHLINECEITTLVIDGLDECPLKVQRELVKTLADLQEQCTSTLQVFVSSRNTREISNLLKDICLAVIDTTNNNTKDITDFVLRTAHKAASDRDTRSLYMKTEGTSQEPEVVKRLLDKADGMFRWVELAFDFLHNSPDGEAMTCRLDDLLHLDKLFDLYDKIYDDMMQRVDKEDRLRIETLLMFILHSNEGFAKLHYIYNQQHRSSDLDIIEIVHMLEACEASAKGDHLGSHMNIARIPALCPSLVVVTKDTRCASLTFPHVSVREWLLTGEKRAHFFSATKGHCFLAQLCMKTICATKRKTDHGHSKALSTSTASVQSQAPSALQYYSSVGWLYHIDYRVELSKSAGTMWTEEAGLRVAFEEFLFGIGNTPDSASSSNASATGLELWHKPGPGGEVADLKPVYTSFYSREKNPGTLNTLRRMPSGMILPSTICAVFGHYYELSRFHDPVMETDDGRTRSLAAVMAIGNMDARKWLFEQLNPRPEVLVDALILTLKDGVWPEPRRIYDEEAPGVSQLIKLLITHKVDVNGRYGPSNMPLLVSLMDAFQQGKSNSSTIPYVATMIASLIKEGADAFVPVRFRNESETPNTDTVFDWLLRLRNVPAIEAVQPIFLAKEWGTSVYSGWLKLACSLGGSSHITLLQCCLEHGVSPLVASESGRLPLQNAMRARCGGAALDLLSTATFAADPGLRADKFTRELVAAWGIIVQQCSRETIKLWMDRGTNIDQPDHNGDKTLHLAMTRTKETGDSEIEEYIRSLLVSSPSDHVVHWDRS